MTHNSDNPKKRTVAIIGRPNVGKSSMFNRLAGKRTALVHAERGVTRDRIISRAEWQGETFEIIDTAGMDILQAEQPGKSGENAIVKGMIAQAKNAVMEAGVIILAVDIQAGVTPQDEVIVEMLRKNGRTALIAANKADNPESDTHTAEFERFGFPVFPVSAIHFRGFEALMQSVMESLPPGENAPENDCIKITVAGRPNVGKSSFINRLLRNDRLIVSDIPGTTRDSIDTSFTIGSGPTARHYLLTDTAGIRKRNKTPGVVDRLSLVKVENSIKSADVVLLMIDATQGPTALDKRIAAMILEYNKGCVLAINKWDLMDDYTQRHYTAELRRNLPFLEFVPLVFLSAENGFNIRKSIDAIDRVAKQISAKLSTGVLNRAIMQAYTNVQPKIIKGKRLKIFYATQTGIKPITVTLFVNKTDKLTPEYRTYLTKKLRAAFGLEGAPIVIKTKGKTTSQKHNR